MKKQQQVVILGASPKIDRYSNKAVKELLAHQHKVYPVHPTCKTICDQPCYPRLEDIKETVDTITLYVGKARSTQLITQILALNPKRIIMNPGAENDELETIAIKKGIEVIRGCTLVMLSTDQF